MTTQFYEKAHALLARRNGGASWAELEAETGWQKSSLKSIVSRAKSGKLRLPKADRKRAWSQQMVDTLKAYWATENSHQLAQRLTPLAGRPISPAAINALARRSGWPKPGAPAHWQSRRCGGGI